MATKPTTIVSSRVSEIAAKIRGHALGIQDADDARADAQEALNSASEQAQGTREAILITVAGLSSAERWLPGEITAACKAAAKGNQSDDDRGAKAMATFISEIKNVANPKVRDWFEDFVNLRDTVWQAEAEEIALAKGEERAPVAPCRKLWSRKYHMLSAMARVVADGQHPFTTVESIVAYAQANDPSLDADKVEKRLKSVVAQLQAVYQEFPHDDVKTCVEFLELVKAADLMAARQKLLATTSEAGVLVAHPEENAAPAAVDEGAQEEVMPSPGAVDLLDDVLNDMQLAA